MLPEQEINVFDCRILNVLEEFFIFIISFFVLYIYWLIKWEGRTGKYLARGHDVRTEHFAMNLVGFCFLYTDKYV